MSELKLTWIPVKQGFVAYDGQRSVGSVLTPRKGNWYVWVILDGTYENNGKANGKQNAMKALEDKYTPKQPPAG